MTPAPRLDSTPTARDRFRLASRFCRLDKRMLDAYDNGGRPSAGLRALYREAWKQLPDSIRRWIKP